MPLNLTMIGAVGTAAGGAAVTALPVATQFNAAGCALIVIGAMIGTRHTLLGELRPQLDQIGADTKRSSDLNRKQAELLETMNDITNNSGPHTLPPPPLRRIG